MPKTFSLEFMETTNKTKKQPVQTEEEKKAQEFVEATAQAIIDMSKGIHALLDGKLSKRAIVILIQDSMGGRYAMSREQVEKVLNAIATLDKTFLV